MEREHVLAFVGLGPVMGIIAGQRCIGSLGAHDPIEYPNGLLVLWPLAAYPARKGIGAGFGQPFSTDDVEHIESIRV